MGNSPCVSADCCVAATTCTEAFALVSPLVCVANFVRDTTKDAETCPNAACVSADRCVAAITCKEAFDNTVSPLVCDANFVRNTTKDSDTCATAACENSLCCMDKKVPDSGAFPSAPLAGMLVALCLHVGSAFA